MTQSEWMSVVAAGVLVMTRLSGLLVFAPVLSSSAIAPRIKAGLVFAMTLLMAASARDAKGAIADITVTTVLSELAVGLVFGLSLSMLNEMVLFAGTMLSMSFSFSLANLMDPMYHEETSVLTQLLNWMTTLILLGAGLHRTLIGAVMRSFRAVPLGTFFMTARSAGAMVHLASGIFLAGVQLASPVIAAALTVEVAIALIGRLAPQLSSTVLSVPFKTIASYVVLIGSLAIWPAFLEGRFDALLDTAGKVLLGQA